MAAGPRGEALDLRSVFLVPIAPCVILTRSVTDVITAGSVLHGDTDFEEILIKNALLRVAENCLKCKHIYTWRYRYRETQGNVNIARMQHCAKQCGIPSQSNA